MADEQPDDPWAAWRTRIVAARRAREDRVGDWQENVRKRTGGTRSGGTRSGDAASTATRTTTAPSTVNKDWPLTKSKLALLYSQTPEIRQTTTDPRAGPAVAAFATQLNAQIKRSRVGAAIEEELADVVNASGISGVLAACETRTETVEVDAVDPMIAAMTGMTEIPKKSVERVTDIRYPVRRISPASLLIPDNFTGSMYDDCDWIGYEGSMPWASAVAEFGLTEDVKEKVVGADRRQTQTNTLNTDSAKFRDQDVVNYQEIFYWCHRYDPQETSFSAMKRHVFVDGLEEPVIDGEPYAGQQRLPNPDGSPGRVVGVTRYPLQILTLTYISDESLPPSDSTITRSAVNALEESREQQALQRKHSIPVGWFDSNRVGPNTRALLEKGTWSGYIPINGPGERAIGQVSRPSFPPEKMMLDQVIDGEITEDWTVGTNQAGGYASGERSAREAGIIQQNFQTRVGQERAKVERHFVAIAEVLAGLMTLHGQAALTAEQLASVEMSVRVDSTVLLSAEQRIEQITRALNLTAQSGHVNPQEPIAEIWALSGFDPSRVVITPQPKGPEPVKVSVSKAEDLVNPLFLATLFHTNQGPTPEDLAAAIKTIQTAMAGGVPIVPMEAVDPNQPPSEVETPPIANATWESAPRIDRRDEDGGA